VTEDARRLSEGERSDHPEWARRQRQRQDIRFHDPHPGRRDPLDKIPEPPSPHWIDFNRDHVDGSAGEGEGDRAGAGADLDDQLTTPKRSVGD
jgi:hypothetical protein